MPSIDATEVPKPKNWQDFERIVHDAMSLRWKSPNLQMNGRPGQAQAGVDIYGSDDIGRQVGIQCKRYKNSPTMLGIEKEIAEAEKFEGKLSTLYIASTADYDSPLQKDVRLLSEQRALAGKFAIGLIFWEDVTNGLKLNPDVFKIHYPYITLSQPSVPNRDRQLAALELGYYGGELNAYVELIHGEAGWMAQADPDSLTSTIQVLERQVAQLLAPSDALPILDSLTAVRMDCLAEKSDESDWDVIKVYSNRVEQRLISAKSLLQNGEDRALELGMQLSRVYHHCDELPTPDFRKQILANATTLCPAKSAGKIKKKFSTASKFNPKAGYLWAPKIFSVVAQELRWTTE